MYLSRLILNPFSHRVRKDLTNIQDLHRTVFSGFPDFRGTLHSPADQGCRVLFRLDTNGPHPVLLIQSSVKPDWAGLSQNRILLDPEGSENPAVKDISKAYNALKAGQTLRFRLRANPTKKTHPETGEENLSDNGRRVFLSQESEQVEWITRKGETGGFTLARSADTEIPDLQVLTENPVTGQRGKRPLFFGSVLFQGRLIITDRDKFLQTLQEGIGSAKGYGFGLLSVARG